MRPIHPFAEELEAHLLPQRDHALLPTCDPVVHVSAPDPVVAQLHLHARSIGRGLRRAAKLAISIGVPRRRINEIVHGKRRITADTALRLTRYFATTDRFGLDLQTRYDLEIEKDHLGTALDQILPLQSD